VAAKRAARSEFQMVADTATRPTLLRRVRCASDDDAWREFEALYGGLIIRYGRRYGLQLVDAEDVCQIVLAKLARSLRSFEYDPSRGRFRDYLGRAVRNAIASFFASHKPVAAMVSLNEATEASAVDYDMDAIWQEEWAQHHYRRALATLRTQVDGRTVEIFNALLTGRSTDDIAEEFSASSAAIRKIKQRVRDRLQAIIESQIQDEELGPQEGDS
jgi:RNA polymerase sigma factor (sigma-70 family)